MGINVLKTEQTLFDNTVIPFSVEIFIFKINSGTRNRKHSTAYFHEHGRSQFLRIFSFVQNSDVFSRTTNTNLFAKPKNLCTKIRYFKQLKCFIAFTFPTFYTRTCKQSKAIWW